MSTSDNCCLIGRGKVYIRPYVNTCCDPLITENTNSFKFLGNVSNFALSISENQNNLKDYTTGGGGTHCSVSFIESVGLTMDLSCYTSENLALAFFGDDAQVIAGTGQVDTFTLGAMPAESFLPLSNTLDSTVNPLVLTDGTTVFVEGTDYILTPNGVEITAATTIPAAAVLTATYDFAGSRSTQMITGSSKQVEVYFDGINSANSGSPFSVHLYKVTLSPAGDMSFISEDFESFSLNGSVDQDDCQTGMGMSKYGEIKQA